MPCLVGILRGEGSGPEVIDATCNVLASVASACAIDRLFRTEDVAPAEFYEPDPLLGWSGMALEGIEFHELSGRDGDYMREPHFREFAKLLNDCLARAQLSARRILVFAAVSNLTS